MPTIIYKPDFVRITVPSQEPIIELNFAMMAMFDWFLGRGVWRFQIDLEKTVDKSCVILGEAKVTPGPLRLSNLCEFAAAVKDGIIPTDIPKAEWFDAHSKDVVVNTGQHRVRLNTNEERTEHVLVNSADAPGITLGTITMSMSNLITGLFAQGVSRFKYQLSQQRWELLVRHGVDRLRFLEYLVRNETGQQLYSWDAPISTLS